MRMRSWIPLCAVALVALLVACDSTPTGPALHENAYGAGQQYQIEISLNCTNAVNCTEVKLPPGSGFGVWLWLELNADGTGDYTGSDCGHNIPGDARNGAIADLGDLTWHDDAVNHRLVIEDVELFGGALGPMTIYVPDTIGHYVLDGAEVFPTVAALLGYTELGDKTQVQVAP